MTSDELDNILDRIANGKHTDADINTLRQLLSSSAHQSLLQLGKYGINVGQGQDIHIGDRIGLDAENVASVLIEVVQALQASPALKHLVNTTQSEEFWKNLTFDQHSAASFVEQINTRLAKLEEIHQVTQLSEQQRHEFNTLKSKVRDLRDINRRLEDIAEDSRQLLQRSIQELAAKLQELSALQQNHLIEVSTQICVQKQLDALTQFQLELEQGKEVADWLARRLSRLAKKIGQEALNTYPQIRDAATAKQTKEFYLTIKQFLERLIKCLELGTNDILEMSNTPIVFDEKLYEAAFKNLKTLLPEQLPKEGIAQLEDYINYFLESLPTYPCQSLD